MGVYFCRNTGLERSLFLLLLLLLLLFLLSFSTLSLSLSRLAGAMYVRMLCTIAKAMHWASDRVVGFDPIFLAFYAMLRDTWVDRTQLAKRYVCAYVRRWHLEGHSNSASRHLQVTRKKLNLVWKSSNKCLMISRRIQLSHQISVSIFETGIKTTSEIKNHFFPCFFL